MDSLFLSYLLMNTGPLERSDLNSARKCIYKVYVSHIYARNEGIRIKSLHDVVSIFSESWPRALLEHVICRVLILQTGVIRTYW